MTFSIKKPIALSLVTAIGFLVVSCGESKVSQCNKLIEVANKAVSDVQTITASANPQDINAMTQIAETADQAIASMQAVELSDETLQGYQQRFVTMYTETSTSTRALVDAVGKQDTAAADQAYNSLKAATDQEGPLVNEVNQYCTQ